tara:strand:- start:494 stop:628 length:135 start_codon:yes stop_codon:yes gene_type:complete
MKKPDFLYSIWAVFNNKDQRQLENLKKKVNIYIRKMFLFIKKFI